ncbi:MAG: hypothetical protein KIPDCIKN_04227 [Haliscomenobacter sp.]|nr:hypothetical protein [Haliscomenobacter sp.]
MLLMAKLYTPNNLFVKKCWAYCQNLFTILTMVTLMGANQNVA